jgi:thiamine-monophosphate kinase
MRSDLPEGSERIAEVGEFGLIDQIRGIAGESSAAAGIGDDAAVIDLGGGDAVLATVDMQVENVHFRLDQHASAELGRRVVAVSVSDIAAMGGIPRHILTSLALPPSTPAAWVEGLYRGMAAEARHWDADIVGGNLARIDGPICLDIIVIGTVPHAEVVARSGGRLGDVLAVTGTLGNAAALRLARERSLDLADLAGPEWIRRAAEVHPRVRQGRALARSRLVHAMIDISDGLAGDVGHLCRASHTGAEIDARLLPIEPEARAIAEALGLDPVTLSLSGGEDYELLIAMSGGALEKAREVTPDIALHAIGRLTAPVKGVSLIDDGVSRPLSGTAWRHF